MWQFHLLCLFTNSYGDLINLGEEKHSKTGYTMPNDCLQNSRFRPSANVLLLLLLFMLVFGSFIKGCAKVRWVTDEGRECWLNTGQSSSKCFSGLLCLLASLTSLGSSSPISLLPLVLIMLLAGMVERMEAGAGPLTRDNGLPCHHLHMPRDTINLWL